MSNCFDNPSCSINITINKIEEEFNTKLENIISKNSKINSEDIQQQTNIDIENSENTLGELKISSENKEDISNEKGQLNKTNQNNVNLDLKKLSPEDHFQLAFDQIRGKKYEEAKFSLKTFIDQNPNNQLSGSAHYWLGELYILNKDFREAALIFAEGYQIYPKSIKAPNMLYKLSETLLEIGKNQEACNTLSKLSKDFPNHKITKKSEKKHLEMSCNISSQ